MPSSDSFSDHDSDSGPSSPTADEAYAEFLRRQRSGDDVDFEDLCHRHRKVEAALRVLHSLHGSGELDRGEPSATGANAGGDIGAPSFIHVLNENFDDVREITFIKTAIEPGPTDPGVTLPEETKKRYSIEGEVGRGGMGAILSATRIGASSSAPAGPMVTLR